MGTDYQRGGRDRTHTRASVNPATPSRLIAIQCPAEPFLYLVANGSGRSRDEGVGTSRRFSARQSAFHGGVAMGSRRSGGGGGVGEQTHTATAAHGRIAEHCAHVCAA